MKGFLVGRAALTSAGRTQSANKINALAMAVSVVLPEIEMEMERELVNPTFKIKAVNLGGWLVTEGWMKPSLFDGIPNKDLLDGTGLQFRSVTVGKYLAAETGGGTIIVANRTSASGWETFRLWRINETTFNFRVFNGQFVGLENGGDGINVVAVSNTTGRSETFEIVRKSDDLNRVRIRATNGFFLQVKSEELVTADFKGDSEWGDDDPSVFVMKTSGELRGEFQVTNGYGPDKAPQVMREHRSTFIVEEDFKFISENGLNAVRIPVGWWIASDPTPPMPFVAGSLQALDNAFTWAQKYKVNVIIDLHAAPGSQNGWEHSASRDGSQEWGKTDENIQETVAVIEFLTARYTKNPSLYAVELINEPLSPGASLDSVKKYYQAGYDAVRRHSSSAYVVMSNRLGPADPKEFFPLASGLQGSVIDIHYYNLFSDIFNNMTVQQNIDFVHTNRSAQLNNVTTSNGPLTFVGEWVAEWQVNGATKEEYQRFAKAQLEVYGRATFGWAYWALQNVNNHWSLEWMIKNGYITLVNPNFKIKAVNLGGWLVTEGWMKPSLFDGIPNNDLLDGTGLQFKSVTVGKYLAAETGGGTIIVANRTAALGWETFKLWRINEKTFNLRVFNRQFMGLENGVDGNGINVVAVSNTTGRWETFEIVRKADDLNRVRIRATNGFFLQVKTEELVTADFKGDSEWGDDDPSVFVMKTSGGLQGEFQVTNGYGPAKAPQVMREHRSTFIVEGDFKFISENGINAVRIPVGWWIASDPTPPMPFVAGSLQALDNAFAWARKYKVKVIIDLHAAPGSQNGWEHSGSRDGSQEWGKTDENIQETIAVIEFLTARYTKNPSLYAVELINEPLAPKASLHSLKKYYKAGYDAVRRHSSSAYVVMSNRVGSPVDPKELFPLASGLKGSVIDIHYYSLFTDDFNNMTVQQNIDFIHANRSAQLNNVTTSNGPLTFIGEWVAEWQVNGATKEDYQRFANAQLEVYGRATFGWAYWALKNVNNHWSLEWMIKNGYITLVNPNFKIKAVNLGGWLVTEGWMKPSLFDGIPNKDLLDGTGLQFKSVTVRKYLAAETGGGTIIVANRTAALGWETFKLWRINEKTFNLRVFNRQFMGLENGGDGINVVAVSNTTGRWETFEIVRKADDLNRVRIRATNGFFLQVKTEELVTADFEGDSEWGDDDPSVFVMKTSGGLQGEFQVTNGYGPAKAPQVMREHRSTFIVEEDFKFISENGLNAVRIPVGWWIASDPTPPMPFAAGSLQALDNAFAWAQKYKVKVIIDLHAAPGSQNGWEHSGSRDGSQEWGKTDENIQETVAVIEFLTARYTKNPSLYAVELINEPLSPGASLDSMKKYYQAGYDAVRRHSSSAYVVMSNRLGPAVDPKELFPLASGLQGSVIDIHYYDFNNMTTVQQNIDFIHTNRSAQLNNVTTSNGPLIFIGEWVTEWQIKGAAKDYQRFAKAQLEVYGQATFGWAYWALKNVNNHWSLEWMIKNGYIKLITGTLTLLKMISNSSTNGLNAVRIPVGWKYGMKIIVDLHAVPGSRNSNDHNGTRDGYQEWGDSNTGYSRGQRIPSSNVP
ncbi:hypothetical protein HHK36_030654 [Tetracentron sinense]|uniref:Mannan endo-1,4-beta-mannosidase n=1 Tax=Tetracentron sinense TaxID=13715 RepID=A0A834YA88_TETSI|nr:hypothetical protein HHK36_030654 [Tetracentron sinense]